MVAHFSLTEEPFSEKGNKAPSIENTHPVHSDIRKLDMDPQQETR